MATDQYESCDIHYEEEKGTVDVELFDVRGFRGSLCKDGGSCCSFGSHAAAVVRKLQDLTAIGFGVLAAAEGVHHLDGYGCALMDFAAPEAWLFSSSSWTAARRRSP